MNDEVESTVCMCPYMQAVVNNINMIGSVPMIRSSKVTMQPCIKKKCMMYTAESTCSLKASNV